MILHLTKEQMRLVTRAVESYSRILKEGLAKQGEGAIKETIEENLFQLDLLETWFDKQREREC